MNWKRAGSETGAPINDPWRLGGGLIRPNLLMAIQNVIQAAGALIRAKAASAASRASA
jgi:hypothetical protein